jgi:hypothetical protein
MAANNETGYVTFTGTHINLQISMKQRSQKQLVPKNVGG